MNIGDIGLTLEEVAKEFESWRKVRAKRTKTPDHLRQLVKHLAKHYKTWEISQSLKIGSDQIKQFLSQDKSSADFIELPSINLPQPSLICAFKRSDGAQLTIEISNTQLAEILKTFLCSK
jgi:hypothetical protein